MRVALVQLDISTAEPIADRVARVEGLVAEAARGSDLVVLPELWHVGAFDIDLAARSGQELDGPLVGLLRRLAADLGVWLHGGSFVEVDTAGGHYNTAVLFDPSGRLAATYRKIHLFGFTGGETTLMGSGEDLVVVDTPLGPTALATCYDLRFPELFRGFVDRGAVAVVMASGWPGARIGHWSVLARARAIENQLTMIACNEVGTHGGTVLGGRSVVVDATGEVLAEAGDGEEILRAEIDTGLAARWREEFPVLTDRRL